MSNTNNKPVQPVAPCGMEMLFLYRCPHCGRKTAIIAPTQPSLTQCEACGMQFPLLPVDEHTVRFFKTMLADGQAAVDPDFV